MNKLKLFANMFIAANTAALAMYLCYKIIEFDNVYCWCLGIFLGARVVLFMANPAMPLTDSNVKFMSEQRIIWNSATIAICTVIICSALLIVRFF